MVKPTIMQQLLKQPSQSYTNNPVSIFDDSASVKRKSTSRAPSSVRSGSIRSGISSHYSDAQSEGGYNDPTPPSRSATGWEWSNFGARKGLTGGPGSIRTPSVIGVPAPGRDSDAHSLKSSRSLRSMRSYTSMNSVGTGYRSIPAGGSAASYGNGQQWTHGVSPSSSKIKHGTSRRYSAAPPTTGYAQPDFSGRRWSTVDVSSMASSPAMSREPSISRSDAGSVDSQAVEKKKKKKKKAKSATGHDLLDDPERAMTPSLSSTLSSAGSSPPQTPTPSISQMSLSNESEQPKRRKKKVLAQVILEADENGWHVTGLESVAEGDEPPEPAHVPSWMPRKRVSEADQSVLSARGDKASLENIRAERKAIPKPVVPVELLPDAIPEEDEGSAAAPAKVLVDQPAAMPSQQVTDVPAVGRKYTMDEFFANLPLSLQGSASTKATGRPVSQELAQKSSAGASSASSYEGSDNSAPSSRETDITRLDSPDETRPPVLPETSAKSEVNPPRIKLTRTESDQAALGIKGDVELSGEDGASRPATRVITARPTLVEGTDNQMILEEGERADDTEMATSGADDQAKPSKRASSPAQPVYEIIATSASKAQAGREQSSSEKAKTPSWQRGVKTLSLDATAQPLIVDGPKRSKSQRIAVQNAEPATLRSSASTPTMRRSLELNRTSEIIVPTASRPVVPPKDSRGSTDLTRVESHVVPHRAASLHSRPGSNRPSLEVAPVELAVPRAPSPAKSVVAPAEPTLGTYGLTAHNLQMAGLDIRQPRSKTARSLFSEPQARVSGFRSSYGGAGGSLRPPSVSGMSVLSTPAAYGRGRNRRPASVAQSAVSRPPTTVSIANIRTARSTMSALSISAAAAGGASRSSRGFSLFKKSKSNALASSTSAAMPAIRFDAARDLTFGTLQPAPSKMRSDEVLVQVISVGVDQFDWEKVKVLARDPSGFGFIPGRSFYGKAVECGDDVKKIKKGDFVYGLNELRRSGALAEYVTVNRDLVSVAPVVPTLSVEQSAVLPHAGIWAVQVMTALCAELERGSKLLILNAHEGVGNMCMRLARHMRPAQDDLWLVAQVPREIRDGEAFCVASGANDVFVDDPLATFNCIHESSFDVVIDTVGGRRIYDASRRILHFTGSFITTVGDSFDPDAQSQWKTSIRSLRRSFFKKDKKSISYWCINLDAREYPRESLDKLREIVEKDESVRPVVNGVLTFEDSRNAFGDGMGSSTVVRVLPA